MQTCHWICVKASFPWLRGHAHACVCVLARGSACLHAVTRLLTLLKEEVAHLLVRPSRHRHHLYSPQDNTPSAVQSSPTWWRLSCPWHVSLSHSLSLSCLRFLLVFLSRISASEAFFCFSHCHSGWRRRCPVSAAAHRSMLLLLSINLPPDAPYTQCSRPNLYMFTHSQNLFSHQNQQLFSTL